MPWLLGIDEAGYGPNLGPFVMTAVTCQVPDPDADLWLSLSAALRKGGRDDGRILVDDSKVVYSSGKGLSGLERGVFSVFGLPSLTVRELVTRLCQSPHDELADEAWFTGVSPLPLDTVFTELQPLRARFDDACRAAAIGDWRAHSLIVCPTRFNAMIERAGSKSAVLSHGFVHLLADAIETLPPGDLHVHVDKQGGRNTYAAQIQHALPRGMVRPVEERAQRSRYRVIGLGRELHLTFEPRADGRWMCVALASMVSKYLRELLMHEFNRFWQQHVPGLKATAGYPGDAPRFLEAIRPIAANLAIPEKAIWRQR